MKKHYAFIPLKDKDLSAFRKSLILGLAIRPAFAAVMLCILGVLGCRSQEILADSLSSLLVFSLGAVLIISLLFNELQKIYLIAHLHKSSLAPFIRVKNADASFYLEELSDGFIVQTLPITHVDISACQILLADIVAQFSDAAGVGDYLIRCINSPDDKLINKAVIYIEIIRDQLDNGNHEILATRDKLINYKEELK